MLHHGGLEHSPTHPPSTALILFGLAYSFTAAALAPAVTRWLDRSSRAWTWTIAANGIVMSVYLWHMTAAVAVAGVAYAAGLLPSAEPGTSAWWWTKIPFLLVNLAVLVPIVRRVAPIEQRALLGGTATWRWGIRSMLVVAALLSLSIKACRPRRRRISQLACALNVSSEFAGMPRVPSSRRTRGIVRSYMALTTTRVGTPSRRAASAGRRTSSSLTAHHLHRA